MKFTLAAALVATVVLTACSSVPNADAPAQKISNTFPRHGVKVEWECHVKANACDDGSFSAIEATGTAVVYGNSEVARENAFTVANDQALVKLSRFLTQDLKSSRVSDTMAKSIHRAVERNTNAKKTGEGNSPIEMSSDEADGQSTTNVNNTSADTVSTVVESIRTNTSQILRGVMVIDERVVDRRTVTVTVRWTSRAASAVQKTQARYFQ